MTVCSMCDHNLPPTPYDQTAVVGDVCERCGRVFAAHDDDDAMSRVFGGRWRRPTVVEKLRRSLDDDQV